jgi:valyl-tRNA synthetase
MPLTSAYNPKNHEEQIVKTWRNKNVGSPEEQIKQQNIANNKNAKTNTIVIPPPNLTGQLHAGHAFEHYMMDILMKIARQNGQIAMYFPGIDHAGIQLEGVINKLINEGEFDSILSIKYPQLLNIEKDDRANTLKKERAELWFELAWEKVNLWRNNQLAQADVLGDTPDFSRLLFSLDDRANKMVNHAFTKYWQDGLIYQDKYLINWSVGLQTALSDVPEDIGHVERIDPLVTINYSLESIQFSIDKSDIEKELEEVIIKVFSTLSVSTVRPETVFADVAIAINPKIIEKKIKANNYSNISSKYIIDLLQSNKLKIVYGIPILNLRNIVLLVDESVEADFGTGCLKITPAHDLTDYMLAQKHNITHYEQAINRQGKLTDICSEFAGQTVERGRLNIIKKLIESGNISKVNLNSYEDEEISNSDQHNQYIEVIVIANNKDKLNDIDNGYNSNDFDYDEVLKVYKEKYKNYNIDWNYKHNVTICERSKTVVEPLISQEFFIDYDKNFDHKPTKLINIKWQDIVIDEKEFILKPISENDSDIILEQMSASDAEMIISPVFTDINHVNDWIAQTKIEHNRGSRLTFGIYLPNLSNEKVEKFIGYCGVRIEDDQYKLTVWIIGDYKRKGYAYKSLKAIMDWSEKNLPVSEFIYEVKSENIASIKLAQKLELIQNTDVKFISGRYKTPNTYYIYYKKVNNTSLQKLAIKGLEKVNFYPEEYRERGIDYFNKIKNWCISRDLLWGHKIPIWYNLDLNQDKKFFSYLESKKPVTVNGFEYKVKDLFQISDTRPASSGNWVREEKVLDTWFSSTLWPLTTLGYYEFETEIIESIKSQNYNVLAHTVEGFQSRFNSQQAQDFAKFYPTQTMTSAWEIFYAWIIRMIMTGMYFTGEIPFENYCCHAWILDDKGRKQSKSLGNGMDPQEFIDKYSSDALRMSLTSGMIPGKNMRMGGRIADSLCEKYRNFGNKMWNIARFLEYKLGEEYNSMKTSQVTNSLNRQTAIPTSINARVKKPTSNLPATLEQLQNVRIDFDFKRFVAPVNKFAPTRLPQNNNKNGDMLLNLKQYVYSNNLNNLSSSSIWILDKYLILHDNLEKNLNNYNIAHNIDELYKFGWDYLANWYVEYLKNDTSQLSFGYRLFKDFIITLYPYMPFEGEVLWADFFKEDKLLAWQLLNKDAVKSITKTVTNYEEKVYEFENIKTLIEQIRSLKGLFGIDYMSKMEVYTQNDISEVHLKFIENITKTTIVKTDQNNLINDNYCLSSGQYSIFINIIKYISDPENEILKTEKNIENLQKQINLLEDQLSNTKFLEKADEDIIEEKKLNLSERKIEVTEQKNKLIILKQST